MESELSPDKEAAVPPVPIKTYQWEDLRRAREVGGYPWTHLLKPELKGEITAEDIIRETTPKRSMSREVSKERSRTCSPVEWDCQKILQLDHSPGSSRKHSEEGDVCGIHVPNFSKEISLECDEDLVSDSVIKYSDKEHPRPKSSSTPHLGITIEKSKSVSPKSILKRKTPEKNVRVVSETREKTKCCHPLVNKIKHIADKTLQKLDKSETELSKKHKNDEIQEIVQLKQSPSSRRQKFGAIKLGDSDEMSRNMQADAINPLRRKEHIYEDIDQSHCEKDIDTSQGLDSISRKSNEDEIYISSKLKETESLSKKSENSQDPSLMADIYNDDLNFSDHVMETLHKVVVSVSTSNDSDNEEPNVDEILEQQLHESLPNSSPKVTITEIFEDQDSQEIAPLKNDMVSEVLVMNTSVTGNTNDLLLESCNTPCERQSVWSKPTRWNSEGGSPRQVPVSPTREGRVQSHTPEVQCACQFFQSYSLLPERLNPVGTRPTSRASNILSQTSDHEYEIVGKPAAKITNTSGDTDNEKIKHSDSYDYEDEASSTNSLDKKFLQSEPEDDQHHYRNSNILSNSENLISPETLQRDIEDRYFISTPSTVSRTECDISTSQVDSSALENLPLKRENRVKNMDTSDNKLQQRIREQTGKLRNQAGKLRTKIKNIKAKQLSKAEKVKGPEIEKTNLKTTERSKITLSGRPKFSLPDKPKFSFPDRKKFSLPERPNFSKFSDKLYIDRKKLSFPDRPKINMPDMSKFKFPDRSKFAVPDRIKIHLANLTSKKKENEVNVSNQAEKNVATLEFDSQTYPRLYGRKKLNDQLISSSPTLNRPDTPPPVFEFAKVGRTKEKIPTYRPESPKEPREYGNFIEISPSDITNGRFVERTEYNFAEDIDLEIPVQKTNNNTKSLPDVSSSKPECSHVLSEINNDEFFLRPKGLSRENIEVRQYLSDEIRQAFKIPSNSLAMMGNEDDNRPDPTYSNDPDDDPELFVENDFFERKIVDEDTNEMDDGYYTFPPIRPSRAKKIKKIIDNIEYMDQSGRASIQFSEVDLEGFDVDPSLPPQEVALEQDAIGNLTQPTQSQTLPLPPKRKKKSLESGVRDSGSQEFHAKSTTDIRHWEFPFENNDEVIVYRTEHEYVIPETSTANAERSPLPPRRVRNRSRSSHGTSFADDDRTSHGAESLLLDTQAQVSDVDLVRDLRQESPGYATVDKCTFAKVERRSKSKTPPVRQRKSHSADRKYFTVDLVKKPQPPPRKKSSSSLMTLDNLQKVSSSDITKYEEIDDFENDKNKDLISGVIINKMKDRPLPPPPRPPRYPKKKNHDNDTQNHNTQNYIKSKSLNELSGTHLHCLDIDSIEVEVSTQTDPLPDDIDYELGADENIDISMSSSLKDIIDEDSVRKSSCKLADTPRHSRPISATDEFSSDTKLADLSKVNIGRTSPTVILVERRVSSPTRINEREELLTEASLTVQHIDIDESKLPEVPPLPKSRGSRPYYKQTRAEETPMMFQPLAIQRQQNQLSTISNETTIEKRDGSEVQVDNLVTQKLQVRDLDVGRLNVAELQAGKILVSDIEGTSMQVNELDSKSGHISVSGIDLSPTIVDEIVKKFAELAVSGTVSHPQVAEIQRPESREEQTQTENVHEEIPMVKTTDEKPDNVTYISDARAQPESFYADDFANATASTSSQQSPPQRPPPPNIPILYSYLQDATHSPSFYPLRAPRDRPFTEFYDSQFQPPPPPIRRTKRKPTHHSESSSEDEKRRPSPRRVPPPVRSHEPTVTEAGAQFIRVCHNSITRTFRNIFNSLMSYISGSEDKKDVQMALVIFLVLVAGLIMFGLSDSRTIHHHHWEFFNPPDGK